MLKLSRDEGPAQRKAWATHTLSNEHVAEWREDVMGTEVDGETRRFGTCSHQSRVSYTT